jgi:hypothetical protein
MMRGVPLLRHALPKNTEMTMRRTLFSLVAAFVLILGTGTASAQEQWSAKRVKLESTNLPGLFIRHSNFEAFLTKVESDLDIRDSAFFQYQAINGGPGVSFESVNFRGRFLRHKHFRLVLEPNDGTQLFADDASFLPTPGPAGATGFEASNFPGHFIRHKNFMLYVDKKDGSELFRADSAFMVRGGGADCVLTAEAHACWNWGSQK